MEQNLLFKISYAEKGGYKKMLIIYYSNLLNMVRSYIRIPGATIRQNIRFDLVMSMRLLENTRGRFHWLLREITVATCWNLQTQET